MSSQRLRNLDLGTLRSFVTIAESGSMTRAAARLFMTQSAISMQIKRLEKSLGCSVLERSPQGMTLSNTESIPGKRIVQFFGVVTGNTVRAKHIGRDIMAGLKNIVGGELVGYTELLQDSRKEATDRMMEQARSMGANAVVNVRFATSSISQGAAELFAYGTAVRVE